MMVSPVQRSDKALGGVRGQVEDGNPGGRRKLDSQGNPGGMRRPQKRGEGLGERKRQVHKGRGETLEDRLPSQRADGGL